MDLDSVDDMDERQIASWMKQAAAMPGFGGKKDSGNDRQEQFCRWIGSQAGPGTLPLLDATGSP